jgi:hypothetical protein
MLVGMKRMTMSTASAPSPERLMRRQQPATVLDGAYFGQSGPRRMSAIFGAALGFMAVIGDDDISSDQRRSRGAARH